MQSEVSRYDAAAKTGLRGADRVRPADRIGCGGRRAARGQAAALARPGAAAAGIGAHGAGCAAGGRIPHTGGGSAPAATPAPTADADADEDAPTTTADGLPIVATSIAGGLSIKNETDIAVDAAALLQQGPAVVLPAGEPQILIMHTHASEAFTPAGRDLYPASDTCRTEDTNYNIVHVGDVLANTLASAGLQVLHDRTIYDYPSYTGSYNRSGAAVQEYLNQYPSLRIVIDLHRDALCSDSVVYKTVAELPDAACSQVMLLVGTNASGLYHPYWEENLRLAVYLQDAVNAAHPTLMRPITLVNERYNQHLTRGSLIIEVGSSGNTLQEAIRAVRLFGESAGPALARLVQ